MTKNNLLMYLRQQLSWQHTAYRMWPADILALGLVPKDYQ